MGRVAIRPAGRRTVVLVADDRGGTGEQLGMELPFLCDRKSVGHERRAQRGGGNRVRIAHRREAQEPFAKPGSGVLHQGTKEEIK